MNRPMAIKKKTKLLKLYFQKSSSFRSRTLSSEHQEHVYKDEKEESSETWIQSNQPIDNYTEYQREEKLKWYVSEWFTEKVAGNTIGFRTTFSLKHCNLLGENHEWTEECIHGLAKHQNRKCNRVRQENSYILDEYEKENS